MAKSILSAIRAEFLDKTDVVLPRDIAERVDNKLKGSDWFEYYHEDAVYLDTAERDIVFDMISIELGFEDGWPLNGSSTSYKNRFTRALAELANKNRANG